MPKKDKNLSDEQRKVAEKIKSEIQKDFKHYYSRKRIARKKNIIMIIIGVLCLTCITLMAVTNYYIFINIPSNVQIADESYSATLLSNGLAIIAIAISVWAGLNIANAVERKELDDTNEKIIQANQKISEAEKCISETEEKIDKAETKISDAERKIADSEHRIIEEESKLNETSNQLQKITNDNKQLIEDSEILKTKIKPLSESIQITQKSLSFMFENELIKTIKDRATLFLYNEFSSKKLEEKNSYNAYYPDLIIIEQLFIRIYETHSSKQLKDIELENIAEKGIKRIDEIIKNGSTKIPVLVLIYLRYRKAEFNYYLGYITADSQKYYNSFTNAAELFIELIPDFNVWIPNCEPNRDAPEYEGKEENREISMYFANSIGDSYSRFLLRADTSGNVINKQGNRLLIDEVIEIGKKGVFYCSCAAKWTNIEERHEVYYRNLGCAYERLEKKENAVGKYYKEVIYNYSMAFKSIANYDEHSYRVQSVYHTLIQYLKKHLDKQLNVDSMFKNINSFKQSLAYSIDLEEENIEYFKRLYYITNFAKLENHRQKLQYSVNGLTLAIILYYKLRKDKTIEEICDLSIDDCLRIIKDDIDVLKMMGTTDKDNYFKELNNRYNIVKEYITDEE